MAKNTSVIGIYPDRTTVSDAISVLHKQGFRQTDVSFLASDNQGSKDFAIEQHNRGLEGAAIGAAACAVLGGALAWFASVQTTPVSGVEMLATAGPVFATLVGAGAGGALGWILGMLAGLGRTQYVAKRYAGRIRHGGILLSVHCDSREWCDRAKKALKDSGAQGISSASEAGADYGTSDKPTERAPAEIAKRDAAPVQETPEYVAQDPRK